MKVLLYGARGLGFEVAKNLALAGPGEMVVFDPFPVDYKDLGANFFFTE
jgi:ubiquitin-activating enzyme E1